MNLFPKEERIINGIKKYQPVLAAAKSRDVGETDTVTIIKDMLADIFGYDKYSELTSEFAIRGTYCDLAIKLENQLTTLIEVKAIGCEGLNGRHKSGLVWALRAQTDTYWNPALAPISRPGLLFTLP